ncbi:MAG: transpeptidase family protein [candidate division Zixibacteria bacterium]|nr:transpeptidase family protein [candidate division Zixibacteria bacterium]
MTSKKKLEIKRRSTILFICSIFFTLAVFLRVFDLQVLRSGYIQRIAIKQQEVCLKLEGKRGVVYDRNLNILAFNLPSESFFGVPYSISRKDLVAKKISGLTDKSYEKIKSSLSLKGKKFVWLKRKCESEEAEKIKKWNLDGVYTQEETKRSYPYYPLACDIIGFADIDNKGLAGIEYQYDHLLSGQDGRGIFQKDGWGNSYQIKESPLSYPQSGKSLVLTIDLDLQAKLEEELKNTIKVTNSQAGSGIFMNPNTGEILAMSFLSQENSGGRYSELRLKNKLVADVFEPGSTFKIITAAAALEKGIKNPEDSIYAELGCYKIGKKVLRDIKEYGWLTFKECVVFSSNIGMAKVAIEVGEKGLFEYAKKLGFGEKTGIDLPGEVRGVLSSPDKRWSDISLATFAMGYGVSVTPLQLITAYAAVANGGLLLKPYVVKAVLDEEGKIIQEFHPIVVKRALKPQTSRILTEFLRGVVSDGTGIEVQIEGVNIAGKTGTAQKTKIGKRGYERGKYMASFVGFFPAEDPQIVGLVILDSPKGLYYGSQTAAPAFRRITQRIIPSQNLLLANELEKTDFSFAVATKQEKVYDSKFRKKLDSKVNNSISRTEKKDNEVEVVGVSMNEINEKNDGRKIMPSVVGLTAREAIKLLSSYSIVSEIRGSGVVRKQHPLPGNMLSQGKTCFLECSLSD